MRLGPREKEALRYMQQHGSMYATVRGYAEWLQGQDGETRPQNPYDVAKRAVRSLQRKGLLERHRGIFWELTEAGATVYRRLKREAEQL